MNELPVYAISMRSRPDRRVACETRFPGAIFIDAVDGRVLPDDPKVPNLTKGERGCFMSHMLALRRVARGVHARALIIEDDCGALDFSKISSVLRDLPVDADALAIGCNYIPPDAPRPTGSLVDFRGIDLYGAHCIMYTKDGAARACASSVPRSVPFDLWISRVLRMYACTPPQAFPVDMRDSDTQRVR